MRVLITGGYGCIGCWIARQLLEEQAEVWVYDLKQDLSRMELVLSPEQLERVRFVAGDVTELDRLEDVMVRERVTHVIHLAGLQVPSCRADPLSGARVNVIGTLCMLEALRRCASQESHLVYASSAAVYGPPEAYPPDVPVDEVRLVPSTHYGAFKVCNETNARVYWLDHQVSSIGLRPWTVFGVGRDQGITSEPTKAIQAVAARRPYRISYGGRQDLQYVADVAGTFVRCLDKPFQGAAVYNLRGWVVDMPEFCQALANVAPEASTLITHGDRQLPIAFDLDDCRLQRDIANIPQTPLEEGIGRTLEHFRQLIRDGKLHNSDLEVEQ